MGANMFYKRGLTLLELVIVLAALAATSSLLVPFFTGTLQTAQEESTKRSLLAARAALLEYWSDTRLIAMDGVTTVAEESDRLELQWLFTNPVSGDQAWAFNPSSRVGWRGPYVTTSTGNPLATGYPHLIDAWASEIVVQDVNPSTRPRDVRIVSPGPNGVIDIPAATPTTALTPTNVGDDVYVAFTLH